MNRYIPLRVYVNIHREDTALAASDSPLTGDSDPTQEFDELDYEEPVSPILHHAKPMSIQE